MDQPLRAREVLNEAIVLRPDDGYLLLRAASLPLDLGQRGAENAQCAEAGSAKTTGCAPAPRSRRAGLTSTPRWSKRAICYSVNHWRWMDMPRWRAGWPGARAAAARTISSKLARNFPITTVCIECTWTGAAILVRANQGGSGKLLELEPADAWPSEAALALAQLKRGEEALQAASEAARIEPHNSCSFSILGHVYRQLSWVAEARALSESHRMERDNSDAVNSLLDLARTDDERKEELAFIERELIRQVVTGDGLLAFLELARPSWNQRHCCGACSRRTPNALICGTSGPRCLSTWPSQTPGRGAFLRQTSYGAIRSFPRTWIDLAMVHQWRDETEQEIAAAERAFEMNPPESRDAGAGQRPRTVRQASEEARRVYEKALRLAPHDASLHAFYASSLWRQRRPMPRSCPSRARFGWRPVTTGPGTSCALGPDN
jgi:tetratricopeptide (TPR) repeat protein